MKSEFEHLFDANHKKVFNIALNIVQSIEDAEDITQEVFVEVYQSLHSFNQNSSASTWIYRIAVNKSLDYLRAKKRKKRFAFLTQLFHPETGEQLHEASIFDHPGVVLENKERSQLLFKALDKLPENQRTAFVLHKIDGFSQKETALLMNLSEKAVESLVQRAKENMKKILGKIYEQRGI
jgi:RNA polymerase sigma factor (sigma-70 family)